MSRRKGLNLMKRGNAAMAMELKLTGLKGFVGEDELAYMAPLV